mmetsp:Transcript_778/g.1088  ORF Transcript_778/g.1088 Transcript_778/m.1088 type:complete len:83 (+) Transcript_778:159-407(+)
MGGPVDNRRKAITKTHREMVSAKKGFIIIISRGRKEFSIVSVDSFLVLWSWKLVRIENRRSKPIMMVTTDAVQSESHTGVYD